MFETPSGHESQDPLSDTDIILVTYRSRDHVEALLASFGDAVSVILVDNSHNSDGVAELAVDRRPIRYLDGGGQGFARAANIGAAASDRTHLLFINPDSRPALDDLRALLSGVEADPSAASHCGTTSSGGQIEMGVGGWEPSVLRCAVHAAGLHRLLPLSGLFAQPSRGQALDVDWCSGASMAIRRDVFKKLGGFDETFYVYAEDIAFGRAARNEGLRTVLREDVVVPHAAGTSGAPSLEMLRLRGASFSYYVTRYHTATAAHAMRSLLAVGSLGRSALARLRGHHQSARLHAAFAQGLIARTAKVAGTEVAQKRYLELNAP